MPIRLTCPSCSATLSVKDEYAGRAVKCPKCGGIIPASQSGAAPAAASPPPPASASPAASPPPPPAPPPAAEKSPFDEMDEPAKPAKATGRPVAKSKDAADDDDDKPRRKGRDEDDDDRDAKGKKGDRDRDRDDDKDRPSRKKRDDDDEDGPPGRGKKKKGGGGGMVLLLVGGFLLLCCGGIAGGGYYVYTKVRKGVEQIADAIDKVNFRVSKFTYDELEVGETTRTQTDTKLGNGRIATDADLSKVFASEPGRSADWTAKVNAKRAIVWQNGDDYIIAAFHPTADGTARLQAKEWRPKSGASVKEGELDDAKFVQQYPVGGGPGIPVSAEELAQAYKDGTATADPKYKKKVLLVEGKLLDIDYNYGTPAELMAILEGVPKTGGGVIQVRVTMASSDTNKLLNASRGQTVKLKGKCTGYNGIMTVELTGGTVEGTSPDPNPVVTAAELISAYAKDSEATDDKYRGKPITITGAIVERKEEEVSLILNAGGPKKGTVTKIKVTVTSDENFKKQIASLKTGAVVKIKGEYSSSFENVININRGYIAP